MSKPIYRKPYNRALRTAYPVGPERSYRYLMRQLLARYRAIVLDEIINKTKLSYVDVSALMRGINTARERADDLFGGDNVEIALRRIFTRLDIHNTSQIRKHLVRMRHIGEIVLERMPREAVLASYVSDNVALIKTIPEKSLGQIGDLVTSAHLSDIRVEDLRNSIMERYEVSRSRAELIARDQIGKKNAAITESKLTQVGIREYIWSCSLDERVRGSFDGTRFGPSSGATGHAKLEGTTQSYNDPPIVDEITGRRANPGEDVQCRCIAIPKIDEVESKEAA